MPQHKTSPAVWSEPAQRQSRRHCRQRTNLRKVLIQAGVLLFLLFSEVLLVPRAHLWAQSSAPSSGQGGTTLPQFAPFWANRGHWNFGFQVGYAVENAIPRNISHIHMLIAQPQLGFIVHDFKGSKFPLRRFEILGEGILGGAVHPGGRMLGATPIFRFDFRPWGRVVPFLDVGSGPLNTTTNEHAPELTGHFQFMSQGGAGIQYFFRPQRALVLEYRYLHLSNAGVEPPNHGFNASMITIGFRWLRRPRL